MKNYMGIDQYGTTYHNLGKHPRKELINRTGYKHIQKMFRDTIEGDYCHVGYVIGPLWVSLYEIKPMRKVVA